LSSLVPDQFETLIAIIAATQFFAEFMVAEHRGQMRQNLQVFVGGFFRYQQSE
jgi:hypothetical protein